MTDKYKNYRVYLVNHLGSLEDIARHAKVTHKELLAIVDGAEITDHMAHALALVTEPMDDQWTLDPDDSGYLDVPDLTDAEIIQRLQHAEQADKLGVIAHVSGVKGGEKALRGICRIGQDATLDPVTRSLLLNVME